MPLWLDTDGVSEEMPSEERMLICTGLACGRNGIAEGFMSALNELGN